MYAYPNTMLQTVAITERQPRTTKVPKNAIGPRFFLCVHECSDSFTQQIVGIKQQSVTEHRPPRIDKTYETFGTKIEIRQEKAVKVIVTPQFALSEKLGILSIKTKKACLHGLQLQGYELIITTRIPTAHKIIVQSGSQLGSAGLQITIGFVQLQVLKQPAVDTTAYTKKSVNKLYTTTFLIRLQLGRTSSEQIGSNYT